MASGVWASDDARSSNGGHHRDKAADLWGKAGDVADQKDVFFIH